MPEFIIEGDALRRERRFSRLSWGTMLALGAVTASLVARRCLGFRLGPSLSWLLGICFLLAFFGSCILAFREALNAAKRQMVFVLNDNGITRNRQGYPPVSIAFSNIDYLGEEGKWLILKSLVPPKKIAIPRDVNGYDLIRTELSKHYPLSSPEKRFRLWSIALIPVSFIAWAAFFWFQDMRVAVPSGVVALMLLLLGSNRLWVLLRNSPKQFLPWVCVGGVWIAATLLIYIRLTQH